MGKIVEIPKISSMVMLECDECKNTTLNLYMDKEFTCLAYRCVLCNYTGYFKMDIIDDLEE